MPALRFWRPDLSYDMDDWAARLNPGQELCGAMIRADAYGYACPGDPELAARLAFRDASFTHRKTGVYSAMFVAAAIAAAFTAENWKEIVVTALQYVPQRSRFYEQASTCLRMVDDAASFEDGYNAVHTEYGAFGAGQVVQEIGTVINTLKFARDAEEGIGMQVAQGNVPTALPAAAVPFWALISPMACLSTGMRSSIIRYTRQWGIFTRPICRL